MDILDNGRKVIRIVITGGPCGGKTSSLKYLLEELGKEEFQKDYAVIAMAETATELIGGGITPWNCLTHYSYQYLQMKLQYTKELVYARAAEEIAMSQEKSVIILYDRGMMDNKAYVSDEEFTELLDKLNLTEGECLSWYDAVFHMTTAAKGAEACYGNDNNKTRMETPEEAIVVDNHSLHAWAAHPNRIILDNSGNFQNKLDRLVAEVRRFLKEDIINETGGKS